MSNVGTASAHPARRLGTRVSFGAEALTFSEWPFTSGVPKAVQRPLFVTDPWAVIASEIRARCPPASLSTATAFLRQAVDNFQLERTSSEILALLGEFSVQWQKYTVQLEKVQLRFEQVSKEYGSLMNTRHRALQRPLDKIDNLRHEERGLLDADIAPLTFPELSAG